MGAAVRKIRVAQSLLGTASMSSTIAFLRTLLVALLAFGPLLANAAPTLARDARGRFLANVSQADVSARAYQKYLARNAAAGSEQHGHDKADYVAALSEVRAEKAEAKRAAKMERVNKTWSLKNGVTVHFERRVFGSSTIGIKTVSGNRNETRTAHYATNGKGVHKSKVTYAKPAVE